MTQAAAAFLLFALAGCGGGGDGGAPTGAYAVTANKKTGSATTLHTVCIEGIAFVDPASTAGERITESLISYYGMSAPATSVSNSAKTCRQLVPGVDQIVSVQEYNNVILPAVQAGGTGKPGGTGGTGTTGTTGTPGSTGTTGTTGTTGSTGAPSYIEWNGSLNGVVVKDAGNEDFAFETKSRCLYSYKRKEITSNFCLGSGAQGSFAGQPVIVMLATALDGRGCIAVLADPTGYQIDIFTDASGRQIVQRGNSRWDTRGC